MNFQQVVSIKLLKGRLTMRPNYFLDRKGKLFYESFMCWLLSWSCEINKSYNIKLYYKSRELLAYLLPSNTFNDDYIIHTIQFINDNNIIYSREFRLMPNFEFFYAVINDSIVLLFTDSEVFIDNDG